MPPNHPSPKALSLLDSLHDPAILLDIDYRILAANEAYQEDVAVGRPLTNLHCYEVSHDYDRPCDQSGECCPLQISAATGHRERMLHIHQSVRGREFVDVEIRPILDKKGEPACFLEILRPTLIASAEPNPIGLVGAAPPFNALLELVQRVAPEQTSVLLLGESGVGKELIARAIHEASKRVKMPFVPVECSGLAENLFESELFGHKKGAFTGAQFEKPGLVEAAHEGTLFLDEIGEVTPQIQVKLLRLLETQTYRRVGDTESRYVDFRLICATNRNLIEQVEKGLFREDLYYRISAFPLQLPSLRQRKEDIGLLAQSLLQRMAGTDQHTLSQEALKGLERYPFPGNIRELQNSLERARILANGPLLLPEHFPGICHPAQSASVSGLAAKEENSIPFQVEGITTLAEVEKAYLRHLLATFPGKREALAHQLGVSLRTLVRKIRDI
ncbi:MAG: sigma 54-interacting transcriptional regulator [Magnetococcales bacterium]|nr:sigma 54-interacting transcriptional regulator [Magnetococcales bacterium]